MLCDVPPCWHLLEEESHLHLQFNCLRCQNPRWLSCFFSNKEDWHTLMGPIMLISGFAKSQTQVWQLQSEREIDRDVLWMWERKIQSTREVLMYIKFILKIKEPITGEGMSCSYIPATLNPFWTCSLCIMLDCTLLEGMCQNGLDQGICQR